MNSKYCVLTLICILMSSVLLFGEIRYDADPRGKVEQITGVGDYVPVNQGVDKKDINDIRWSFKGGDQDWEFTRVTHDKQERFWISILKVDGVWVTRTKYRFKEGGSGEVTEKDKSGKFIADCRITEGKVILILNRKKKGYLFKITRIDGNIQINYTNIFNLEDRTINLKKQ